MLYSCDFQFVVTLGSRPFVIVRARGLNKFLNDIKPYVPSSCYYISKFFCIVVSFNAFVYLLDF
jgi:hypothetical protein